MFHWRHDEIRELLSVRADTEIVRQIQGTARDSVVYDQITSRLRDRGVVRNKAQVNSKLKALKRQYHQVVDRDGQSGNDRKTWCYFSLCEAIWGSSHSTNPEALVGTLETASTLRSPETLSMSSCPETPSTSSFPETPYSDTEERIPVHEIDVSINDSVLSTESLCRSPPKRRRKRNQTRSERVFAEMRDLFSEMDKQFHEQERLRLLEQREYEERVRREARVEKAQEMALLQDITSLLREMVQRMPATQPQASAQIQNVKEES
ncbi:uncharacterized protein LOC118769095 [Megalops cyprinoides]|uniref:uncharacterized protein LOC118769095 n=1 Tax=Megalops cyprinoides TaxID=118141 RepID=UPI0018641764|nr:uncharacterized protein LOC118769095 [Megalops cyprinoides]